MAKKLERGVGGGLGEGLSYYSKQHIITVCRDISDFLSSDFVLRYVYQRPLL